MLEPLKYTSTFTLVVEPFWRTRMVPEEALLVSISHPLFFKVVVPLEEEGLEEDVEEEGLEEVAGLEEDAEEEGLEEVAGLEEDAEEEGLEEVAGLEEDAEEEGLEEVAGLEEDAEEEGLEEGLLFSLLSFFPVSLAASIFLRASSASFMERSTVITERAGRVML